MENINKIIVRPGLSIKLINQQLEKYISISQEITDERKKLYILLTLLDTDIPENLCLAIDQILINERQNIFDLFTQTNKKILLYKGDITKIRIDAIVNAANGGMCGCYNPTHKCIDNVIHSKAGPRLRMCCRKLMKEKNYSVLVTPGFCLPCKYIIHVEGPIYNSFSNKISEQQTLRAHQDNKLAECYLNSLNISKRYNIKSIAFCCISTGLYGYPQQLAAQIAISTVKRWLTQNNDYNINIVFDVFTDTDCNIYKKLLS